ncbi:MAG: DALR domain-containing protein, partial [Oscillospiraceae bacterium]
SGSRVDVSEHKEDPLDFVLWKGAKPGEPFWPSPWGDGRPGWHIECTAMIRKHLGDTIDIHCGGSDLIFPHHENEIAQGECCTGKDYAHYWMHNGFINVDNKKMSKSLGNFFTTREVANKFGYEPIKFMMLQAHYRSPINYSYDVIEQCKAALERLTTCRNNLDFAAQHPSADATEGEEAFFAQVDVRRAAFIEAMDDDLNTADAISVLFELARDCNSFFIEPRSKAALDAATRCFDELTDVLGLLNHREKEDLNVEIEALIEQRQAARKAKDFKTADAIRDQLKAQGITLEDTAQGIKWHRES